MVMALFGDLVPDGGNGPVPGGWHPGGSYPPVTTPPVTTPPATTPPATTPPATTPPAGTGTTPATPSALSAWDTFYASPAYQVPLQQGLKAVNTSYAAKGALESGAAMQAINNYAAGNASGALSGYLDDLYRQEALGMSASSALAGVGQNMVGQVSANNNNAAAAAGNAQLIAGQGAANTWNSVGSAVGSVAGSVAGALGSSYGGSPAVGNTTANYNNTGSSDFYGLSDIQAKDDIKRVGTTNGGLPVYTFRYKGSDELRMGVMAQDVAELQPIALGPKVSGLMTVDYASIR